jgi:hypothetical protein
MDRLITCAEMYSEMIMVMLQVMGLTIKDPQESEKVLPKVTFLGLFVVHMCAH